MKALSITFGASVLACGNGPCANQPSLGTSVTNFGVQQQFTDYSAQPNFGSSYSRPPVSYSPFAANKPWQSANQVSIPSNWQNSPSSVWTSAQAQPQAPARVPATPRPPNPSLAGRSPSEQLQITKCRSAQSCEKCRQLNCFWDVTGRITNRCIALGLESTQIPVEAGQASNLGYCPTSGQPGFAGVNWLAIENSGAAVPNLEGMSDANVQQWLSTISNYNPDATDANYPAGDAFKELLPTASKAYADGKIPSTTPWISFFDSLSTISGGYSYDGYFDSSYTYDVPADYSSMSVGNSAFGNFGSSAFGNSAFAGSSGFDSNFGNSWDNSYPLVPTSYGDVYPSTTSFSGSFSTIPSLSTSCCGHNNAPSIVGSQFGAQLSAPSFSQAAPSFSQAATSFHQPSAPSFHQPSAPSFHQHMGIPFSESSFPQQPLGSPFPQSLGSIPQPVGFGSQLPSQPVGFGPALSQPSSGPSWSG